MKIEIFIANFAAQLEETDASIITADTKFRELDEWDSLMALYIIAMVDEEYGVKIKGDDMRNSICIKDLYEIVKARFKTTLV
jgi:acyl carrier protein